MTIRRASVKDAEGIIKLLYQVAKIHHGLRPDIFKPEGKKYSANEISEILEDYSRPIFVATDGDGGIAAYCFCIMQRHGNGILRKIKTLYVDDLCVDENARGKGLGGALLDYVTAFAKSEKCYNVTLNAWCGNDSALTFYEKKGFTPQKITFEKIL